MMDNDMLKMLGIFLIVAYIIYLAYKSMNMNVDFLEGLENKIKFQNGIAGNAEEYATNI
jgi:preprotein translocase subunit SecF